MSAIFRLVLRTQVTRGRALALGSMAVVGLLLGFAIGRSDTFDRSGAAYGFVTGYALSLLVPVTTLVFAAAALGDPAEDGTLVYLWHRPVSRFTIAISSAAAALCIAVPFGVLPAVAIAAVTGVGTDLVAAAAVSTFVATIAYSGLFLCLGLVVRRALAWGLAYVLIWEGFVARSATGPARLSVLVYARSLLADIAGQDPPRLAASVPVAIAVPVVVGLLSVVATASFLRRIDVR